MKTTINIAQISDCHLPGDRDITYRGIDAWLNLERLLERLRKIGLDMVLATGDLSEDASSTSYRALRSLLGNLGIPLLALPGNHDDPELMGQFFPSSPVDDLAVTNHAGWQVIRINSCVEGEVHGYLEEEVLESLQMTLEKEQGRPRLLAMHHQPVLVDSPWIDKYRLRDPESLLSIIDKYTDIKAVVWGHIHQQFEAQRNETLMLGCPSTAINSLKGADKFTPADYGPAFRWLKLGSDGSLYSRVVTV